jgi:chromosome transmission fidelity protein 4
VPLLDTKQLDRLASGRKEETYWPVAVAQNAFHCIILKGGDKYPYFPRPLLSEFEFNIPVSSAPRKDSTKDDMDTEEDASAGHAVQSKLQESFVRESLSLSLLEDVVSAPEGATVAQDAERRRKEVDIDKVILQLLAIECREGAERSMKAYELVTMVRDRTGKILDAAVKIAQRYDRTLLGEKIRELAERRLMGEDEDEGYDNVGF